MKEEFIKKREDVQNDVQEMVDYLKVSDQKQRGPARPMLRTAEGKYELHEVLLAIVNKLKQLEKKRPVRAKKNAESGHTKALD